MDSFVYIIALFAFIYTTIVFAGAILHETLPFVWDYYANEKLKDDLRTGGINYNTMQIVIYFAIWLTCAIYLFG